VAVHIAAHRPRVISHVGVLMDKFLGNLESSIVRYPLQWVVSSALIGLIVGWVL